MSDLIAVTGSTGFLGRHLVPALKQDGHTVFEVSRQQGFDLCAFDTLAGVPPFGTLIHLAAKTFVPDSYGNSRAFYETNIAGTLNALELCKQHRASILFASSYVYGRPTYLPIDEAHPTGLWNPYATSKIIGEQLCQAYAKDFEVPARILRLFNVYGAGQAPHFLIPTIIAGLRQNHLRLKSAKPKRDFVYVLDVVEAVKACLATPWTGTQVFNVGSGQSYSVTDVVQHAMDLLGAQVEVTYANEERKDEVMDVVADVTAIQQTLGWTPQYDLRAGLGHLLQTA